MRLTICNFEISKLLQEIGFDLITNTMYTKHGDVCYRDSILGSRVGLYPRETLALIQMWLREVYDMHCNILYCPVNKRYDVWYDLVSGAPDDSFKSHDEALEQCILKSIKLIKTKQDEAT